MQRKIRCTPPRLLKNHERPQVLDGIMKQTTLASFFKKPATKAPEEPQAKKGPGAEVVGRRLKVWWPADEAWYSGGVASYDGERHAIQYDDGDEEAVDLSREKFEFLEGTHSPKEVKRETKRPAPSSGLTAEQRADRERKRRKAQDSDETSWSTTTRPSPRRRKKRRSSTRATMRTNRSRSGS